MDVERLETIPGTQGECPACGVAMPLRLLRRLGAALWVIDRGVCVGCEAELALARETSA